MVVQRVQVLKIGATHGVKSSAIIGLDVNAVPAGSHVEWRRALEESGRTRSPGKSRETFRRISRAAHSPARLRYIKVIMHGLRCAEESDLLRTRSAAPTMLYVISSS